MDIRILILEEDGSFTIENKQVDNELDALKWSSRFLSSFKGDSFNRVVKCMFYNKILTYDSEIGQLSIGEKKNPVRFR